MTYLVLPKSFVIYLLDLNPGGFADDLCGTSQKVLQMTYQFPFNSFCKLFVRFTLGVDESKVGRKNWKLVFGQVPRTIYTWWYAPQARLGENLDQLPAPLPRI